MRNMSLSSDGTLLNLDHVPRFYLHTCLFVRLLFLNKVFHTVVKIQPDLAIIIIEMVTRRDRWNSETINYKYIHLIWIDHFLIEAWIF